MTATPAIRCALGARPDQLFLDVMGCALSIVVAGFSVGIVMAVVLEVRGSSMHRLSC